MIASASGLSSISLPWIVFLLRIYPHFQTHRTVDLIFWGAIYLSTNLSIYLSIYLSINVFTYSCIYPLLMWVVDKLMPPCGTT